MSELKTNKIQTNDTNNVAIDNALGLKSYTTTQRDALTSVAGDMIFNSDGNKVQVYDGSSWVDLGAITQGAAITVDYLVAAGGGGGGEHGTRGAGGGGAGGVANSYNSETCGRFARSYSSLSLYKNLRYNVSIGSGGAGGTAANVMPYHGNGSSFHTVSVPGGSPGSDGHANGGRSHYGGSGGGGGGGANHLSGTQGRGNETYGFDGGNGYNASNNWQGGGGGGIGGNGSAAVSGRGGAGGVGKVFTILSSSNATTASVGEVSGTDVYYGGGGGGSGYSSTQVSSGGLGGGGDGNVSSANDALNEGSPNTGGGGGAKGAGSATDAGSGGSGVVILRYPNTATINTIGLTSQTFTEGSDKVTAITAGTGQVYWE